MTYLDYINLFWQHNDIQIFTLAETKLYFFLLSMANKNKWQQPFNCSNQQILAATGISKPSLIAARQGLVERDIISFTHGGRGQHSTCTYTLRVKVRVKQIDSKVYPKVYPNEEKEKNPPFTPLIKEKENNKEKERDKEVSHTSIIIEESPIFPTPYMAEEIKVTDILLRIRKTDRTWIERFCMNNLIPERDFNIMSDIFIQELQNRNIKTKTIRDYQSHFASWFKIQKEKNERAKHIPNSKADRHAQSLQSLATDLINDLDSLDREYIAQSGGTQEAVLGTDRTAEGVQQGLGDYPFEEPP